MNSNPTRISINASTPTSMHLAIEQNTIYSDFMQIIVEFKIFALCDSCGFSYRWILWHFSSKTERLRAQMTWRSASDWCVHWKWLNHIGVSCGTYIPRPTSMHAIQTFGTHLVSHVRHILLFMWKFSSSPTPLLLYLLSVSVSVYVWVFHFSFVVFLIDDRCLVSVFSLLYPNITSASIHTIYGTFINACENHWLKQLSRNSYPLEISVSPNGPMWIADWIQYSECHFALYRDCSNFSE